MSRARRPELPPAALLNATSRPANFVRTRSHARTSRGARAVAKAGQFAAGREIGHDQRRRVVAIMPGDDDVGHIRRAVGDELEPERPDADPGAGRKLEVFGNAPVEDEAAFRVALVGEAQRVAKPVVALLVECRLGQLRLAPVAGRDARAFHPRLELARVWDELDRDAGIGDADDALLTRAIRCAERGGAGLGRAKRGQHRNDFADSREPELIEFAADVRRQRRARIAEGLQPEIEAPAQLFIRLEVGQQHLEAPRHVVVHGRRDLAQNSAPSPRSRPGSGLPSSM